MNRPKTTSWMWRDEDGGTSGADLDFSNGVVRWFDGIACACDDNKLEQTFADFLKRGAHYGDPPRDIEDEMRASVRIAAGESEPVTS